MPPANIDVMRVLDRLEELQGSLRHYVDRNLPSPYKRDLSPLLDELGGQVSRLGAMLFADPRTAPVVEEPEPEPGEPLTWADKAKAKLEQVERERKEAREARLLRAETSKVAALMVTGHTNHCAFRIVHGDGECECKKGGVQGGQTPA